MNPTRKQIVARSFLLIVILSLLVSCSKDVEPLPSDATFVDNLYDNKFFSFRIQVPEGWYSVNEETMQAISETGKAMIAGDDKNMAASIEAAQKNAYKLIQIFQVAPGTPADYYNSNITCIAERVSQYPGIKTGKDYLLNAKKLLNSGQVNIIFDDEIQHHNIGGREFYNMNGSVTMMGYDIEQKLYATYYNGYVLFFVVSSSGTEQQTTIEESINSIIFY